MERQEEHFRVECGELQEHVQLLREKYEAVAAENQVGVQVLKNSPSHLASLGTMHCILGGGM